ncbi:response regulator [Rhabdochromatium marinum]|nr:response regulator [Rhabdochromatium marinum]
MSTTSNQLSQKSVLVVDDYAEMRNVLRAILRSLEISNFELASNGNEALTIIRKRRPDIILCDYNLGDGKDGQQVLEEARDRQLIGVETIFVMLTAENTREMVMAAVEHIPDSFLTKPFTAELLKTRLEKLIQRKARLSKVDQALLAKNYTGAINGLNSLLADKPKNRLELLKIKAEALISANHLEEARKVYQGVCDERDVRWARIGLGNVHLLKKEYPKAEEILRGLISEDPAIIHAYDLLAKVLLAEGRLEDAETILEQAAELSPRGLKRQVMLAELAFKEGDTESAEKWFRNAVKLAKHSHHNHPAIYGGLALSLTANGKHPEAVKVAHELSRNFVGHSEVEFYRATATAMIKANQGELKEAAAALAIAELERDAVSGARASQLGLEMIGVYAKLGQREKAEAILHNAIANNHDDEGVLKQIKQICENAGLEETDEKQVNQIRQEVIKVNNAGVRLIKEGNYEAAIKMLRDAADKLPGNKTVSLNTAKALIMKMEQQGVQADDLHLLRDYIEQVRIVAPDDWRLADVSSRLQRLMANKEKV